MLDNRTDYANNYNHETDNGNGSVPLSDQEMQILDLAILFHDSVYDTLISKMGYSEIESAKKFISFAAETGMVLIVSNL
jgi:hypothetical protein